MNFFFIASFSSSFTTNEGKKLKKSKYDHFKNNMLLDCDTIDSLPSILTANGSSS